MLIVERRRRRLLWLHKEITRLLRSVVGGGQKATWIVQFGLLSASIQGKQYEHIEEQQARTEE